MKTKRKKHQTAPLPVTIHVIKVFQLNCPQTEPMPLEWVMGLTSSEIEADGQLLDVFVDYPAFADYYLAKTRGGTA